LAGLVEVPHPVTGLALALENQAAGRNAGRALLGQVETGKMPSVTLRTNAAPVVPEATVRELAGRFGLVGADDSLRAVRSDTDGLRMTHDHWVQLFQGVPVYGAGLSVHSNAAGEIVCVTGRLLPEAARSLAAPAADASSGTPAASSAPVPSAPVVLREMLTLDAGAARLAALRAACGTASLLAGHPLTVTQPPKLWLYNDAFVRNQPPAASRPAWEVPLAATDEDLAETLLLDAASGAVLARLSGLDFATQRWVYDCGTHYGSNSCAIDISTYYFGAIFYYGRSEGKPARGPNPNAAPINGSTDVDYFYETGIPNINSFYLTKFGRDGMNAYGGTNTPSVPPSNSSPTNRTIFFANADWSDSGLTYCQNPAGFAWGSTTSVAACRGSKTNDLIAHEFSHLVARNMSFNLDGTRNSLNKSPESGALNESNSDLMGESYEKFMTGTNDWIFWAEDTGKRILPDPESVINPFTILTPYPARFNSPNFYCGTVDAGGIHHNSTVPSHAAYLAAEGGTFNGCQMAGIGLGKVEQIWYRALTQYYQPSETFNLAYQALRQACLDLYSTADCAEVTKALQAVEMDQPGKCSGLPARPATCAPPPVLRVENTALGPRFYWGSDCAGWTLQVSFDLKGATGWTDVQPITAPGEYLPQVSAPAIFCRLRYGN
jgi:hypothetical protein